VALKPTADVNDFLNANPIRQQYLSSLSARGVDPNGISYFSAASDPAGTGDDLTQLTDSLNTNIVIPSGGVPITGVEMWLGAYQDPDGTLEAEQLLVADLQDGTQTLLTWVQADNNALSGNSDPVSGDGDFYGDTTTGATLSSVDTVGQVAGVITAAQKILIALRFRLCYILCYFRAYVSYLLCIAQAIRDCLFTFPPSLSCLRIRLLLCRLAFWIRVNVLCYIQCLLQAILAVTTVQASQSVGTRPAQLAAPSPGAMSQPNQGKRRPGYWPRRPISRSNLTGLKQVPAYS
jgi:hypothetical protein